MEKNRFYSFFRALLRPLFCLLFPVKMMGRENLPETTKTLMISNHLAAADVGIIILRTPGYKRLIAKRELYDNRWFRPLGVKAGVFFIDRDAPDFATIRNIINAIKAGQSVSMFPEGTRNRNDTNLQEIKPGAAMFALKGGAVVVPLIIHHKQKFLRQNYAYIGKCRCLNELFGERADTQKIEVATKVIAQMMQETKDVLDDIVENKRWKELRAAAKQRKVRQKQYRKQGACGAAAAAAFAAAL